ncbi:MAG: M50 family metallopeptidase [Chloroflexi bacterium]|nr:M50 family metallopeptidase [Chloroflexota bacterium]MBV9897371.1 M50 family metallopeptidase [Chloroflexota bacterium]
MAAFVLAQRRQIDRVLWRGRLHLGGDQGIEVSLHIGFVLTLVTVTWLLAAALFPYLFPGWEPGLYWVVATGVALIDSFAGLAHELGHAIVAVARGRRVYHISLHGLVAAARRTAGPARPRDQFAIALAGPVSHLLVACALLCAWRLLPIDNEPLRVAMGFPAISNFAAGLLNLLPVSPLDGGRVARAVIAWLFGV